MALDPKVAADVSRQARSIGSTIIDGLSYPNRLGSGVEDARGAAWNLMDLLRPEAHAGLAERIIVDLTETAMQAGENGSYSGRAPAPAGPAGVPGSGAPSPSLSPSTAGSVAAHVVVGVVLGAAAAGLGVLVWDFILERRRRRAAR